MKLTLSVLFPHKDLIGKHRKRYSITTLYTDWETYEHSLGIPSQKTLILHHVTIIQSENLQKDKEISFIASTFNHLRQDLVDYLQDHENSNMVYNALMFHWKTQNYDSTLCLEKFCRNRAFSPQDQYVIFDRRKIVLTSLLDLGLKLYGAGWDRALVDNTQLAIAFDKTPIFSVAHNQHVYNSSQISISISHPQAKAHAFPWRIYDILASNSLLISSYSKLLDDTLRPYTQIPMYHSPYDARELCKYYLNNPDKHDAIIRASNQFIEEHGRWESNFQKMEEFLGIQLVHTKSKKTNSL